MGRISVAQQNFNAGEFSPLLAGRTEFAKTNNALDQCVNFIPLVQGPVIKRPGTRFVAEVKNSADRTWLVHWQFSRDDAYVLEFGDQYIRFFTNRGQVVSGGVPYEVATPWTAADLTAADGTFKLGMVQSGDVLYICHPSYQPRKLSRLGATNWTLTALETTGGPFADINTDETLTVYASADTGAVTLTASGAIFSAEHVGRLFYLEAGLNDPTTQWEPSTAISAGDLRKYELNTYSAQNSATTGSIAPTHTIGTAYDGNAGVKWKYLDSGYGWVRIDSVVSSTSANATVIKRLPQGVVGSANVTYNWAHAAWNDVSGWPEFVCFFRERLVFGRGRRLWFSVGADYENFEKKDAGVITNEMGITAELSSNEIDETTWLAPAKGPLFVGTEGGEWTISESTTTDPFSPTNIHAKQHTAHGSMRVAPLLAGESLLFIQGTGKTIRELKYNFEVDGYQTLDLTVLRRPFDESGLVSWAYQRNPLSIVWCVRADGKLLGMTFDREQDVIGWHTHELGGTSAKVESVAAIPSPDGSRDDLWMIVSRTINGATRRYVEYMTEGLIPTVTLATSSYMDSCLSLSSSTTVSTVSGLDHLEGETVGVLADGATHPDRVVSGGSITLDRSAYDVVVGLKYTSKLKTLRVDSGAMDGTSLGKNQRIHRLVLKLYETINLKVGPDETTLAEIPWRTSSDKMDAPPPLFTGDKEAFHDGGYDSDARVVIHHDWPTPATLLSLTMQLRTYDR